jgi:hypothetical protein
MSTIAASPPTTAMSCPDEETFSRFVQGLIEPARADEVERHIDQCPRCSELAVQFGRLAGRTSGVALELDPWGAADRRLARLEVLLAILHLAWAYVALPLAAHRDQLAAALGGGDGFGRVLSGIVQPWVLYARIWAPLGGLAALLAALGLWQGRRFGRWLATWHALLSLPSLVLTPLCGYVLHLGAGARGSSGRARR